MGRLVSRQHPSKAQGPHLHQGISRRSLLAASLASLAPSIARASSPPGSSAPGALGPPSDHGRVVPPLAIPDIPVLTHEGMSVRWPSLVKHRATALQFMFTSCTVTCPLEGAIFERTQSLLPDSAARGIQLLSVSVDPQRDTPQALRRWLQRFHARPGWVAVSPRIEDVERARGVGGRGKDPSDNHSTQVHIVNREGLLIWRTFELPEPEEIAAILLKV